MARTFTPSNGGFGGGRPRFTQDDVESLLARYDDGESAYAIAKSLGCTAPAVYYHLHRTGRVVARPRAQHQTVHHSKGACSCSRCGVTFTPDLCPDCIEVEGVA